MSAMYDFEEAPRVLCFGDSNTWGYEPLTGKRYASGVRWTGVLAKALGGDFRVVEEGHNGRTTVFEDPVHAGRAGIDYLPTLLESHAPLALVVIMLGTNDFKTRYTATAKDIALCMGRLADLVRLSPTGLGGEPPRVLLVAPPALGPLKADGFLENYEGGPEKSRLYASRLEAVAAAHGADFLDAGLSAVSCCGDGLHLDPPEHAKLGLAVAAKVREILA